MALFSAFDKRINTSTTQNFSYADSFNRTNSASNVVSDQGNFSLTLGGGMDGVTGTPLDRVLPLVAVGLLALGALAVLRNRS